MRKNDFHIRTMSQQRKAVMVSIININHQHSNNHQHPSQPKLASVDLPN
jgi:hypothetical protein